MGHRKMWDKEQNLPFLKISTSCSKAQFRPGEAIRSDLLCLKVGQRSSFLPNSERHPPPQPPCQGMGPTMNGSLAPGQGLCRGEGGSFGRRCLLISRQLHKHFRFIWGTPKRRPTLLRWEGPSHSREGVFLLSGVGKGSWAPAQGWSQRRHVICHEVTHTGSPSKDRCVKHRGNSLLYWTKGS